MVAVYICNHVIDITQNSPSCRAWIGNSMIIPTDIRINLSIGLLLHLIIILLLQYLLVFTYKFKGMYILQIINYII